MSDNEKSWGFSGYITVLPESRKETSVSDNEKLAGVESAEEFLTNLCCEWLEPVQYAAEELRRRDAATHRAALVVARDAMCHLCVGKTAHFDDDEGLYYHDGFRKCLASPICAEIEKLDKEQA